MDVVAVPVEIIAGAVVAPWWSAARLPSSRSFGPGTIMVRRGVVDAKEALMDRRRGYWSAERVAGPDGVGPGNRAAVVVMEAVPVQTQHCGVIAEGMAGCLEGAVCQRTDGLARVQ